MARRKAPRGAGLKPRPPKYLLKRRRLLAYYRPQGGAWNWRVRKWSTWETVDDFDTLQAAKEIRREHVKMELRDGRDDERQWAIFFRGKRTNIQTFGKKGKIKEGY